MSDATLSFAAMGALATTQELAARIVEDIESADPEVVSEETFALVATVSSRALESVLGPSNALAASVLRLPLIYRDYVAGGFVVRGEVDEALIQDDVLDEGLLRRRAFYEAHFAASTVPGSGVLRDKMGLWVGRVSPPSTGELPMDRLDRLALTEVLGVHLRLLVAFARRQASLGADEATGRRQA